MDRMAILGRPSRADDERAAAWRDWLLRQEPLAIAAFVLGAVSMLHAGTLLVDGIAGVLLGAAALVRLSTRGGEPAAAKDKGYALAWGGILLGALSLGIAAYLYSLPVGAAAGSTTGPAATGPR
jgi:hypothetical protein